MNTKQRTIAQRSASLLRLVTWLFVSLAVLLVLERFGSVGLQFARSGATAGSLRRLAHECIRACPEVLYLLALWWIRQALAAMADGALYNEPIARMLERVGTTLAAGAFISVFLVPSASRLVGYGPGYLIAYDISSLVLGAVGLSLKLIAHLLRQAAEMQAELDEIF
jgi:hypothetical protein